MIKETFEISEAELLPYLEMIAKDSGCTLDMVKKIIRLMFVMQSRHEANPEAGKMTHEILQDVATLERKARLYDLLISEEKKAQEEMAGK